jgi:hypothetical protein
MPSEAIPTSLFDLKFVLPLLFGGLAGAGFTQLISFLVYKYRRPRLEFVFSASRDGCIVDTSYPSDARRPGKQRWLRVCVKNAGRTTAHKVNVCATKIEFFGKTDPNVMFTDEVLDLRVALSHLPTFDLPPGLHRFVDLFAVEDVGQGANPFFAFAIIPDRLPLLQWGVGSYCVHLIAVADNADPKMKPFNFHWDNRTIEDLTIP